MPESQNDILAPDIRKRAGQTYVKEKNNKKPASSKIQSLKGAICSNLPDITGVLTC